MRSYHRAMIEAHVAISVACKALIAILRAVQRSSTIRAGMHVVEYWRLQ